MRLGGVLLLAGAAAANTEIPFDFLHNQVVLAVSVNGSGPYNFVLDTGTHASTIGLGLAQRLRIRLASSRTQSRGAGSARVLGRTAVVEHLAIGGLEVGQLPVVALDLSRVSAQLGRPLHGVLGNNFLATRVTQIDYFRRRVRFLAESVAPLPDDTRRISFPMRFRSGGVLPLLEDCSINGTTVPVTLDTGSSLGLILFPGAIRLLGLAELARRGTPMDAAGYRGTARLTKGWVRSVTLKTIEMGAIEVAYVRSGYGEGDSPERRGGNLGNAVLQDFVVTLDYPKRLVVLESAVE